MRRLDSRAVAEDNPPAPREEEVEGEEGFRLTLREEGKKGKRKERDVSVSLEKARGVAPSPDPRPHSGLFRVLRGAPRRLRGLGWTWGSPEIKEKKRFGFGFGFA